MLPSPDHAGFVEGAPDLAVAILSPSNAASGIEDKVRDYLAAGARHVWVVDSAERTVAVHGGAGGPTVVGLTQELDGGDVVPGFRLRLANLFAE